MGSKLSDVISKVQKLIRLADNSDKPGEVAAAQSLAQELITKYQIEEAQLNDHVGEGGITSKRVETPKPYSIDKSVLLNSIAKYNFCKVLRGDTYCMIYGYESDIELCIALYDVLSMHMISEMSIKLKKAKKSQQEKVFTKTWIKSFFGGYAISISERIRESKEKIISEAELTNTSVALVVKDKQYAIEDYFQKLDYTPSYERKLSSTSGFSEGMDSAKKASLNQSAIEG